MQKLSFKVTVSYFERGALKTIEKEITASSSMLAWKAGVNLLPVDSLTQSQSKVQPKKGGR